MKIKQGLASVNPRSSLTKVPPFAREREPPEGGSLALLGASALKQSGRKSRSQSSRVTVAWLPRGFSLRRDITWPPPTPHQLDLRIRGSFNTQSASAEGFGRSIWFSRYLVFAERADHFFAFRALVASFHEEVIRVQCYGFPLRE